MRITLLGFLVVVGTLLVVVYAVKTYHETHQENRE